MYGRNQKIDIRLTAELLKAIDKAAAASFQSRSSYIRETLALRINRQIVSTQQSEEDKLQAIINAAMNEP